jgi:hypothetical protein
VGEKRAGDLFCSCRRGELPPLTLRDQGFRLTYRLFLIAFATTIFTGFWQPPQEAMASAKQAEITALARIFAIVRGVSEDDIFCSFYLSLI